MNAQKYFEQHAEDLIARYAGKNVALFFRGFVPENVRWLAQREDADGTVSIAKIDAAKRKLVQSLMMQDGVTVGIYEEMLAILQTVQEPESMFDAEFIVIDNNAFPAYVPSCIPAADADALAEAYESEKNDLAPEAEVLSRYYAGVRILDEHYYLALFNKHKSENIRCLPFYQKQQTAFTDADTECGKQYLRCALLPCFSVWYDICPELCREAGENRAGNHQPLPCHPQAVLGRECRFPDAGLLQRPCRWDGDKADQSGRDHQHHR